MRALTYRRVLAGLFVAAFAPQILRALCWAVPVVLGLITSEASEGLAASAIALLLTAGLVLVLLKGVALGWHRWTGRRQD